MMTAGSRVVTERWQRLLATLMFVLLLTLGSPSFSQDYKFRYALGRGPMSAPYGIARDSSGNVYVADSNNDTVLKFTSAGLFVNQW